MKVFNAMQPGEHLAAARSALATGQADEALRHAQAITKGPLAPEARTLETEIAAAHQKATDERNAAARVAALAQERMKESASNLQSELKNRGYDLTVSLADKPGEITIVSPDFGDTDHRVRFLSFLRGQNSPASEVCAAGLYNVRLKNGEWFGGFSEVYSLDCFR